MTRAPEEVADVLRARLEELVAIPRGLTGDGVRASLAAMGRATPFTVHEIASGTPVFDWVVPDEWNLRRATLTAPDGTVVADSDDTPLHVLSHSEPVDVELDLDDLQDHLFSVPELPDAIPFRNSYYDRKWGFCMSHRVRESLPPGRYRATIDASLEPGSLTWGEVVLPGERPEVVLLTTHTCHPAMANDNASGMAVLSLLADHLASLPRRRWTYHLVANPGTIGSLVWLHQNPDVRRRVVAGVTMAGLGDPGAPAWKRTFGGDTWVDRAAAHVLARHGGSSADYSPWGYDERQYNAPGFRLPVGHLGRTKHGTYPEYHTSLDDLSFVTDDALVDSFGVLTDLVEVLEGDEAFRSLVPDGEPRLGARGLYPSTGGQQAQQDSMALLWILAQADGDHTLLDAAVAGDLPFGAVRRNADRLLAADLLEPAAPDAQPWSRA